MDAASVADFARQSASHRHAIFAPLTAPLGIAYAGVTYPAVVSTLSITRADLSSGAWPVEVTTTIRVRRATGIAPGDGGLITLLHSGRVVRIIQIRDNVPEEWLLGCADPEN